MADNKVKVKIETDGDLKGVKAIENEIKKIENNKIGLDTSSAKSRLQELETLKKQMKQDGNWDLNVDSSKIDNEIQELKRRLGEVDDEPLKPQLDNTEVMVGIQNIKEGFDSVRQSASEMKEVMSEVLEASGRMENMETFLSMNIGGDKAKKKLDEIRKVTDALPGDDVTLQNLLSQAVVKDANMTADAMTSMGQASADYMASMQNFGKSATETQQDLMNYLLAGNTAEIERSPILQSHIDKLKEGNTVQERSKLLQEALTEEGWAGISQQDTYNNKLQKFNDMLARGKMSMGDLFQKSAKQGMDFLLQLDEATGGLVGMSLALTEMASPLTSLVMGLGQMATGLHAISSVNLNFLREGLTGVSGVLTNVNGKVSGLANSIKINLVGAFNSLKNTLTGTIIPALRSAMVSMFNLGRSALITGANALKSAGAWLLTKAQLITSTAATWMQTIANWALNSSLLANPITWVVVALIALAGAFIWAYQNVSWFRDGINNTWATITSFASMLVNTITGAVNTVANIFQQIPQALQRCLTWAYNLVMNNPLVKALRWLGEQAVSAFSKLGLGQGSPGKIYEAMQNELEWTEDAVNNSTLTNSTSGLGESLSNTFNPVLNNGLNSTGASGNNNITINIENVDSEDRIQQIIKAVEDALKFDNLTAGRSV